MTEAATARRRDRQDIWERVRELVDRAPSVDALRAHRVQLIAAAMWHAAGRPVPPELADEARAAAMMRLAAPVVLMRARTAYRGRLMLMKGPEVAARYAHPAGRAFHDLDLLADDAEAAQRALLSGGFVESEDRRDYTGHVHLHPLVWPGLPLKLELHHELNCPPGLPQPSPGELFDQAVPSSTGIEGLLAPSPATHPLLLAAHAWAHAPLGRLGDLIDVAVTIPQGERTRVAVLARRWGWARLWQTTLSAVDSVLADGLTPPALRTWARHLAAVREVSVLENHIVRLSAPVFALPARQGVAGVAVALRDTTRPRPGESWLGKVSRSTVAARHAFANKSEHDSRVGLDPWGR